MEWPEKCSSCAGIAHRSKTGLEPSQNGEKSHNKTETEGGVLRVTDVVSVMELRLWPLENANKNLGFDKAQTTKNNINKRGTCEQRGRGLLPEVSYQRKEYEARKEECGLIQVLLFLLF